MVTCLDYIIISIASYYTSTNQWDATPRGHMVDGWTVQTWEKGTVFGNGFQGGIWQNDSDVIVGCCGTNPDDGGKFFQDAIADLKVMLGRIPSQANSARKMVRAAKNIANGRRVTITGHSLGGALAQVVGVWEDVKFVTFNAPPMQNNVFKSLTDFLGDPAACLASAAARTIGQAPGINFRIEGDLVSDHLHGLRGTHVGMVVDLPNPTGGSNHITINCEMALRYSDWGSINPFGD